jgi:hypothetical protein
MLFSDLHYCLLIYEDLERVIKGINRATLGPENPTLLAMGFFYATYRSTVSN